MLQPGDRVDRYRALHPLGRGGTAEVWAVEHVTLGTRHALKLLRTARPGLRERLLREGRVQGRLDPIHVVPVTDVVEVHGLPALVMALVDGCSLAELLEPVGDALPAHEPTEDEAVALVADLARGVAAAHRAGVVHRDLKPSNVLLEVARGRVVVRIADFGIARELDDGGATLTGAFLGTPAYAAPEQLSDASAVDARADVWSLGVVLYELLVGRRPFGADSVEALLYAVHRDPPDLAVLPPRWRALVARLLDPDRSRRPTAEALLEAFREGAPPEALGAASEDALAAGRPLAEAVRLRTEAHAARARATAPTDEASASHLPPEPDVFVGREAELAALADLLAASRVVSVLGVGGTGKTRLVVRFGWRHRPEWSGGVWFCDLTEARSATGALAAVARALDVPLDGADPAAQLGHALASRGRCLVVLDNAEQVAGELAAILGPWLDRAPEASFLVTSRKRLQVAGERSLPLEPLEPEPGAELFVHRAAAARLGFEPSPEDREAIDALVALLDGLPLAIELAAARVRSLAPARILARMTDRFGVLASRRGRPDRHATLRATLDDSWALLSADEQAGLARLSVFEGGFDVPAAEVVLSLEQAWAQDVIEGLVDHSLVRRLGRGRLGLLVSVREYAASQLDPADRAAAEHRHGVFFARSGAPEALDALDRHGGAARRRALAVDLDNVVAATRRAVERGDGATAASCALAAWAVLELTGPVALGVALLEAARGVPGQGDDVRLVEALGRATLAAGRPEAAEVLATQGLSSGGPTQGLAVLADDAALLGLSGAVAHARGRTGEALERYERALAASRRAGEERVAGTVLAALGDLHREQGRGDEALRHYEAALATLRALGNRRGEARVLGDLALLQIERGRMDEAETLVEEALAVAREEGDRRAEGWLYGVLGELRWDQGRYDDAGRWYDEALAALRPVGARREEATVLGYVSTLLQTRGKLEEGLRESERVLDICRELGDRAQEGVALAHVGLALGRLGHPEAAIERYEESIAIAREVGHRSNEAVTLGNLGVRLARLGRLDEAHDHYQAALAIDREIGDRRAEGIVRTHLGTLERTRSPQASLEHYQAALALLREVGDRRFEASALAGMGHLHRAAGRDEEARGAFEGALAVFHEVGDTTEEADLLCHLARLDLDGGASGAARARLEAAAALAQEIHYVELDGIVLAVRGALALREGDRAGARVALEEAEAILRRVGGRDSMGCVLCDRARLAREDGDVAGAEALLAEATAIAEAVGSGDGMLLRRRLREARA
jgi:predicted ATPase